MKPRKDLKKYGILTDYKGGDPAIDAVIESIKKDPEMRHMWGLGERLKVKKNKPIDSLKIAKKKKKSKTRTA